MFFWLNFFYNLGLHISLFQLYSSQFMHLALIEFLKNCNFSILTYTILNLTFPKLT